MTTLMPAVDAHHHLWDSMQHSYPYLTDGSRDRMHGKPLPRVYSIDDYSRDIAGLNIVKSVHIQCGWNPADPVGETRWLDSIAQQTGYPTAIVAHADLSDPAVERTLAAHRAASSRLRGIRQHVGWHDNPRYRLAGRPDMLRDPAWQRGFALLGKFDLAFELQAFYPQFQDAAELAARFPQTPILLGNAGMPVDRAPDAIASWREELRRLAARPNVYAKIGGFSMVDHHWTPDSIAPFVSDLIGIFGVDRCMFGSNFPVDGLYQDFGGMWRDYHAVVAELPEADRHKLFHDNAVRVYRLS